jgi:phosphonate transport system substrate-binding protein
MKRLFGFLMLGLILGSLLGCAPKVTSTPTPVVSPTPPPTWTPIACVGQAITLGEIADKPNEVITSMQPLADYLAERLADFGYQCGKVKVVLTIDEMIQAIKDGEVDLYMDSIFPAALVSNGTGAQPILRRQRNCDPDYYTIIFTTPDSGITSVDDLPGQMMAMDRSYSTSGFALPAAYLLDHGLNLVIKESWDEPVASDEVGIYFSTDDKNTLNLILAGKASAGATDDYYFGKGEEAKPGTLVNLAETAPVLRQVVLVRSSLEGDVQEAIKRGLSEAHLNPDGASVLLQAENSCVFDEPPDGIEAVISQMQAIYEKIKDIPGWKEAYEQGH